MLVSANILSLIAPLEKLLLFLFHPSCYLWLQTPAPKSYIGYLQTLSTGLLYSHLKLKSHSPIKHKCFRNMYIIWVKQITSPGWMHETSAQTWCTGKTQKDRAEREVGGGIGMGNTCKTMADSCRCMTKPLQYCKVISLQLIKKKILIKK